MDGSSRTGRHQAETRVQRAGWTQAAVRLSCSGNFLGSVPVPMRPCSVKCKYGSCHSPRHHFSLITLDVLWSVSIRSVVRAKIPDTAPLPHREVCSQSHYTSRSREFRLTPQTAVVPGHQAMCEPPKHEVLGLPLAKRSTQGVSHVLQAGPSPEFVLLMLRFLSQQHLGKLFCPHITLQTP